MGLGITNFLGLLLFMAMEVCFQFWFVVWVFGFVFGFLPFWVEVGEKNVDFFFPTSTLPSHGT